MPSLEDVVRALAKHVNVTGDPDDEQTVSDFLSEHQPTDAAADATAAESVKTSRTAKGQ